MNTTESRFPTPSPVSEKIHSAHKLLISVCHAAVCISICTASIALGRDNQQLPGKEPVVFERYSCKIILPGKLWRWFEPPELEEGKAFIVHDSMANVMLEIRPAEVDELTDSFARNVEAGVLSATGGKKVKNRRITHQGRPCYEFTAFVDVLDAETTTRLFVAGGFLYSLTASIPSKATSLVSASDVLDKCFEFTGTIEPEKSQDADSQADSESVSQASGGWLLWGCLAVLIVGVGILFLLIRKRKKA